MDWSHRAPDAPEASDLSTAGPPPIATRSLDEVHETVPVGYPRFWRRMFAFSGPAYMVSVGYMDPGNWATDIGGLAVQL